MKRIIKYLFLILHFSFFIFPVWGQYNGYEDIWEPEVIIKHDTVVVYDTLFISNLEDVTRIFKMTFQDFSKQLLQAVGEQDSIELSHLEQIYLNYLLPMYFPTYMEHRYIYRNYKVDIEHDKVHLNKEALSVPPDTFKDSLQLDALLTWRGEVHTDYFLQSPALCSACLEQFFLSIHQTYGGKIKGVHLYFPDFSFKEKRAMAQFIKSASLVIDSCKIETIRGMQLFVSFDREIGNENQSFLYALTQMVDKVFLVNSRSPHWTAEEITVLTEADAMHSGWFTKMLDQFYLARYYTHPFPETSNKELTAIDLRKLIAADYPDCTWEIYLFILIGIFVGIILFFVLFRYAPPLSVFVCYHFPLLIGLLFMLVFEVCILFICMVENMSNEHVFTLEGDNIHAILFLPLIFIFIFPLWSKLNNRRERP